jgi:hypothetical protein
LGYYGALDSSNLSYYGLNNSQGATTTIINGVNCVISLNTNDTYRNQTGPIMGPRGTTRGPLNAYYDESEDLSGGGYYYTDVNGNSPNNVGSIYYSPCTYDFFKNNPMSIGNKSLNVLRTDRLPSSDFVVKL